MADARFYRRQGPFTISALAPALGGTLAGAAASDDLITDVAGIDDAAATILVFAATERALATLEGRHYGAVLTTPALAGSRPDTGRPAILHADPADAFATAIGLFYPDAGAVDVHSGPAIHPEAIIADTVKLGHGVVVGAGAQIGAGTVIGPYALIGPGVAIGRDCRIAGQTSISFSLLGDRVVIHPGVRIGTDGFGYASGAAGHRKIPQIGRTIIQDDVEIGANSTIDRGALGDTVIGEGTKIDNLVHIAHNCIIGRRVILAAQTGVAGSTRIGDWTVLGGQVGVSDHIEIGPGARIAAKSGITKDLAGRADYGGYPARPVMQWRREMAALRRLTRGTTRRDE
jgi:UDP-3-O-[3-hydroxymyristoyl] glucosamine N-acyltransferase